MIGVSVYAAIAGSVFISLWKHPAVGLAAVLCMFGLEQWGQATTTFFTQHQTATNYLIGIIVVLALIVQAIKKGFSLIADYPLVGWLTFTLFLYAFASTQWSPRPDISLSIWESRWPYIVTMLILSPLIITATRDLRICFTALLLVGGTLTVLLLFFVKWESRLIVLGNSFGNPLAIAGMAGMVTFIAVLADPWPHSKLWLPVKWGLVALCLIVVVRSGSRGQLIGLIVLTAACWPLSRRIANIRQFIAWVLLLLFFGAITTWALEAFWIAQETNSATGNRWSEASMQGDMSDRFALALSLVHVWYSTPESVFFGLGNSASYDPRILGFYPHFVPLEILAEEGIVGFSLFLLILFVSTRTAFRCYKQVQQVPSERPIFAVLVAIFLYSLLLALKQGSLVGNLELFMFGIILGRYQKCFFMPHHETSLESPQDSTLKEIDRFPVLR